MPKNKVSEWSATAANNTDIGGINIAEGCAPSGINNAIRELMAQVKDMQAGSDSDPLVVGGAFTCSGAAVFSSTVAVSGVSTFNGNTVMNANNTLGNASTDAHTVNGTMTFATSGVVLLDDSVTTASAPPLAFDGDTDTGIYRSAANQLSIGTGASERVRVANTGVTVNQALTVSGAATLSSTLSVTGTTTLTGAAALNGGATAPTRSYGDNTTNVATTAFVQAALQAAYPVGSIYINATNSTNPDTLLGFGTWVAFGAGRVMVGFNSSDPLFDAAEETGGSKDAIVVSHTHTITDPGHTHTTNADRWNSPVTGAPDGFSPGFKDAAATINSATTGISINSTGSSGTNANLQPYITVYMWKRTA